MTPTPLELKDQALVKYETFYLTIELDDVTYTFAEHPMPGLDVTGYGLSYISSIGSKLEPFKGRASLSEATFQLANLNDIARALISKDAFNSKVTVYGGYKDLPITDFEVITIGYISRSKLQPDGSFIFSIRDYRTKLTGDIFNIKWGRGTTDALVDEFAVLITFTADGMVEGFDHQGSGDWLISPLVADGEFPGGQYIVIDDEIMKVTAYNTAYNRLTVERGQLGTIAKSHPKQSEVREMLVYKNFIIDMMLQTLETGSVDGLNGPYDLGVPNWGFNLPDDLINESSFLDYAATEDFNITELEFWLMEPESGLQFFEDEFLRMTLGYLLNDNQGRLKYRLLDLPTELGWDYADPILIGEHEIVGTPSWQYDMGLMYNYIDYGFNYNPLYGEYGFRSLYKSDDAIEYYNNRSSFVLNSRGLRMHSVSATNNAFEYLLALMRRMFGMTLQSIPVIEFVTFLTRQRLSGGKRAHMHHRIIPSVQDTGDIDQDIMITEADVNYKTGTTKVKALQVDIDPYFERTTDTLMQLTSTYILYKSSADTYYYNSSYDVKFSWPVDYIGSDAIQVKFNVGGTGAGTADLSLYYQDWLNQPEMAKITFTLQSQNGWFEQILTFPNFRDGIYHIKFDWWQGTAHVTNVQIIQVDYISDSWEYTGITP